jgi:phosphopantetheine adenylyltransferase
VGVNPGKVPLFSLDERLEMLRAAVADEGWSNVEAAALAASRSTSHASAARNTSCAACAP